MAPTLALVNLLSAAIASLFYGMYFVLFCISMYLLVRRCVLTNGNKYAPVFRSMVVISAVLLFCSVTAHWLVVFYRGVLGLVYFHNGSDPDLFYDDGSQVTDVALDALLAISILIGDFMIIYRLWVVWSHSKLVLVVPMCSLLALVVLSILSVLTTESMTETSGNDKLLTPDSVLTLLTNIYCTAMITWKIWRVVRLCEPLNGTSLREFLGIIVESAAIYACVSCVLRQQVRLSWN
ncbi:hypothetical protein DFH07DRAFT_1060354, partial [Mycena maculata]